MSDQDSCWACGKSLEGATSVCPHCNMPINIEEKDSDVDFLDDLLTSTSSPSQTQDTDNLDFSLPDMDYVSGSKDQSSTTPADWEQTTGEPSTSLDEPVLPDFDYVEGKKEVTSTPLGEIDQAVEKKSETSAMLADVDALLEDTPSETTNDDSIPEMPDFDEILEKETIDIEEEIEDYSIISLSSLSTKKMIVFFSKQWIYWTILFFAVTVASLTIISPNFNPENIHAYDYIIKPDAFVLGWICFVPMGWYFSYRLRVMRISPSWRYGVIYLFGQLVVMYIFSIIAKFMLNPGSLFGNYQLSKGYFLTIYSFLPIVYLVTGITAGFFIFFLSYSIFWDRIFHMTPLSKLKPSLAEI